MNTVFIGGSRHVSRLPANARERLNNVIESGFSVLVGDANGADKAVQKHLVDAKYDQVTVFCSGGACRNNLGQWKTTNITAAKNAKGFEFYAAKDREMARAAEFGLMIWDGKSAGTILNVLRLVRAGKKAVLINVPEKSTITFKAAKDWDAFLSRCSSELRNDLKERATPEEWEPFTPRQSDLLDASPTEPSRPDVFAASDDDLAMAIDGALASTDHKAVVDLLGRIAKARGMSQVAKDTGLAREALYRALSADGNPEFATVLKVINSVGLRLTVNRPG
ncbi:MAG: addiction module antidote protein [Roseiarcus sp.]